VGFWRLNLLIALSILGFGLSQAASALFFKLAANSPFGTLAWWVYFGAGNLVGFGCPVALSFALRGTQANVVYALCYGGGFCLIQIATWLIFRQPLSPLQWGGVALILGGILLLQLGK
jgi:multidrug transporter EmrE-like cation transporter